MFALFFFRRAISAPYADKASDQKPPAGNDPSSKDPPKDLPKEVGYELMVHENDCPAADSNITRMIEGQA